MSFEIACSKITNINGTIFNSNWVKFVDGGTFYLQLPLDCNDNCSTIVTDNYDYLLSVAKSNPISYEDLPYEIRIEVDE